MEKPSDKRYVVLIYVLLALATTAAYEPVRHNGFINFDDFQYVIQNPQVNGGLTGDSVVWAFTSGYATNWHPLTWLSHMLDVELFGMAPLGHHLVSVFFHLINVLLVFWVFKRMTGAVWRSAFIAAVFALHPLRVESVAWAAERKDVLSGMFWLLTMAAYIRYTERPRLGRYLLVLLSLALGLMAKPMLVTLPFVLLLMDYWPLRRFQWRRKDKLELQDPEQTEVGDADRQGTSILRLLAEKVPLLALVAASSIITFLVQQSGGAMATEGSLPLHVRMSNATISYIDYIAKMIYPKGLAVLYPHPFFEGVLIWLPIIALLILLAVSAWVIYTARRKRYLAVGWLWYVGTLVPVIGLVQVGNQGMADRYTYLSAIGISIIIAWGVTDLLTNWSARRFRLAIRAVIIWGLFRLLGFSRVGDVIIAAWIVAEIIAERRHQRLGLKITAVVTLAILLMCTRIQLGHWKNSATLCEHSITVTQNNYIMHNNYGDYLFRHGQAEQAILQFQEAVRIHPDYISAHRNLANALLEDKRLDEAIEHYNKVLSVRSDWPDVYNNLGLAYARQGKFELAIENYKKALTISPDDPDALGNLAIARKLQQQKEDASPGQVN